MLPNCAPSTTPVSRSSWRSARRCGGHTLFRGLKLVPGGSLWRFAPGARVATHALLRACRLGSAAHAVRREFESAFRRDLRPSAAGVPAHGTGRGPVAHRRPGHAHDRRLHAARRSRRPWPTPTRRRETMRLLDLTIARQVAGLTRHAAPRAATLAPTSSTGSPRHVDRTVYDQRRLRRRARRP